MASPIRKFDLASTEERVFETTRNLLAELGNTHAIDAVRGTARLDHDLGLGSLERVELLTRLDRTLGISLPDSVIAEANTLDELIAAVWNASESHSTSTLEASPIPAWEIASEKTGDSPTDAMQSADTWQEVIRRRARMDGDRTHLILWDDGAESRRISFAELHAGAEIVAAGLAKRGITKGDAVALMLPTSADFFLAFAGVLLAGAVPVPIYPPLQANRLQEYAERQSAILCNAQARLLITFREAAGVARLLQPMVPSLIGVVTAESLLAGGLPRYSTALPTTPVQAASGDLGLLQYTSGSTGDPKGVMLTHANLLANVRAIGVALSIQSDDVGVSWLPLYHDMGLIGAWLMPLYFGLPVVVLSPLAFLTRPVRWLQAFHRYRGTISAAPNFAYELTVRKIADSDIEGLDLSTLRAALNGAEPVSPETMDRFAERFAPYGLRREALMPVYGLAEASLAVTIPPLGRGLYVDRVERETFAREGRAVPAAPDSPADDSAVLSFVSVGRPIPDHEVRIVDANGREVAERVEGALWFRGPSTTSGYFANPSVSSALFPEGAEAGWVHSGDRAYRVDDEFFITGRTKDIILKAGRNIYPNDVEEIAAQVDGVRKGCVAAFGASDPGSGTERLVVVAETRERQPAVRKRIAAAIAESVSAKIGLPPDAVELLPPHSIPKTSSGKLRRDYARQLYLAGTLGAAGRAPWLQAAILAISGVARTTKPLVRAGLEKLYGVYAAAVFLLWLPLTWFLVVLAPSRASAARITSSGLRVYLALVGCRLRVEGREHMATPAARVFVCNHTSYFDVLVIMAGLGVEYHFIAKKEVHDMPFIGTFLRKLGHFSFDRNDPQARARQAKEMQEALRRGESLFVFPEGTFTPQPGIRAFQLGAFKAAVSEHCPILPVALLGTRSFLRDGSVLPRPTSVTIVICPALNFLAHSEDDDLKEVVRLRDESRRIIAQHTGEPLL